MMDRGPVNLIHADYHIDTRAWVAALADLRALAGRHPEGVARVEAAFADWHAEQVGIWCDWQPRSIPGGTVVMELHPGPAMLDLLAQLRAEVPA